MTQAELADAIGVTKQQISNIELGRSAMSAVMLAKMAKCLSTTTAKLLEGIA